MNEPENDTPDARGYLPNAPYPGGAFTPIGGYGRLWVGYNLGGEKHGSEAAHYHNVRPFMDFPMDEDRRHCLPMVSGSGRWHVGMKCFYVETYAETARFEFRWMDDSRRYGTSAKCATWAEAVSTLRDLLLAAEEWMDGQIVADVADEMQRRTNPCAGVGLPVTRPGGLCSACGAAKVSGATKGYDRLAFPHVTKVS